MEKKYYSETNHRTPRPRSKRLRELGAGGSGNGSGSASGGSALGGIGGGHIHANKDTLDALLKDDDGYLNFTSQVENEETGETENRTEKAKVGSADKLTAPRKLWGQEFDGTKDVSGHILLGIGQRIYFGDESHYIELAEDSFHFSHGVHSDSFMTAYGVNGGGSIAGSIVNYQQVFSGDGEKIGVITIDGVQTDIFAPKGGGTPVDLSAYALKTEIPAVPTEGQIKTILGISDWALAAVKPSYTFSEITGKVAAVQLPDLYWANVKVSSEADSATQPTVYSLIATKQIGIGGTDATYAALYQMATSTGVFTIERQPGTKYTLMYADKGGLIIMGGMTSTGKSINTPLVVDGSNNRVGIDVLAPEEALHVKGGVILQNGINKVTLSVDADGNLKVDKGLYSESFLSAYGVNGENNSGGSMVSFAPLVNRGTIIGTITIDGKPQDIYAPNGGASSWSEISDKPFVSIGTGLSVTNGVLSATATGGVTSVGNQTGDITLLGGQTTDGSINLAIDANKKISASIVGWANKRNNTAPKQGEWFAGTPLIGSDGAMEVGRYIDFHPTSTSTLDYNVRLDAGNGTTNRVFQFPEKGGTLATTDDLSPAKILALGNVYWANIPIKATSDTDTAPTFGEITVARGVNRSGTALNYVTNGTNYGWSINSTEFMNTFFVNGGMRSTTLYVGTSDRTSSTSIRMYNNAGTTYIAKFESSASLAGGLVIYGSGTATYNELIILGGASGNGTINPVLNVYGAQEKVGVNTLSPDSALHVNGELTLENSAGKKVKLSVDDSGYLRIDKGTYSDSFVSAYGVNGENASGGSNVTIKGLLNTGTAIGTITVDGTDYVLKAPSGGGGDTGNYLSLNGGTLTNASFGGQLEIYRSANNGAPAIKYTAQNQSGTKYTVGYIGLRPNLTASENNYPFWCNDPNTLYKLWSEKDYSLKTISSAAALNAAYSEVATDNKIVPTMAFLSWWNGRYNSTSSNLAYCNQGAFGTSVTHAHSDYVTSLSFSSNKLQFSKGGTSQTGITIGYATSAGSATTSGSCTGNAATATSASKLSVYSKTAWGKTYWTSGGVPTSIDGDMSDVGNISFSACGKNIGGVLYFDTTNKRIGIGGSAAYFYYDSTNKCIRTNVGIVSESYVSAYGLDPNATKDTELSVALKMKKGHLYLDGATGSSIENTTQIIFRQGTTSPTEHLALSSLNNRLFINQGYGNSTRQTWIGCGDATTVFGSTGHTFMHSNVVICDATNMHSDYALYVKKVSGKTYSAFFSDSININGSVVSSSDIRLKNVGADVLLDVKDIASAPCFEFTYKDDDIMSTHVGTSAQYWNDILPNAVNHGENDMLTLDYIALSYSACVALAKKSENHEERIKALEDENERLKQKIKKLEGV